MVEAEGEEGGGAMAEQEVRAVEERELLMKDLDTRIVVQVVRPPTCPIILMLTLRILTLG